MLAIEVDYLLMFGDEERERRMQRSQRRFTFGKIEEIDEKGVNFHGGRLRQVGEDVLLEGLCSREIASCEIGCKLEGEAEGLKAF